MQLTQFSDYALRILLYLGANPDRHVALAEVSKAYGISYHHLVKVAHLLVQRHFVESVRGRGGGLRLACAASEIRIGEVLRGTEPDFRLVECFAPETNTCPIVPACKLAHVLAEAKEQFFATLDCYTLADLLGPRTTLLRLWKGRATAPADGSPAD